LFQKKVHEASAKEQKKESEYSRIRPNFLGIPLGFPVGFPESGNPTGIPRFPVGKWESQWDSHSGNSAKSGEKSFAGNPRNAILKNGR